MIQPRVFRPFDMHREHKSFLATAELKVLIPIAARLPHWVTPDKLSAFGVLGAATTAVACVAAGVNLNFLYIGILGLVINWLGDSLDGTLARLRGIERPAYGFYVDLCSDVASHTMIIFGLGLSPLMHLSTALMALLGSIVLQFYDVLQLPISRVHQASHFGFGSTEIRLLIIGGFLLVLIFGQHSVNVIGPVTIFDVVGFTVFVVSAIGVVMAFWRDRSKFVQLDSVRVRVRSRENSRLCFCGIHQHRLSPIKEKSR